MLAAARARGARPSAFRSYARSLPAVAPDAASWPRAVLAALLSGTDLRGAAEAQGSELAGLWRRLRRCAAARRVTRASLRWAHGMWRSRGFHAAAVDATLAALAGGGARGAAPDDAPYETAFAPLLDYLNHSAECGASCRFAGTPRGVVLSNSQPLARGEQAFYSYGATRSNEELLAGCVVVLSPSVSWNARARLEAAARRPPSSLELSSRGASPIFARYGFALRENAHDAVALLLAGSDGAEARVRIKRGARVPARLWRILARGGVAARARRLLGREEGAASPTAPPRHDRARLAGALRAKLAALDAGDAVGERGPPPLSAEAARVYDAVRESAAHYRAGLRDVLREAIAALEAPGDLPAHSGSESGSESAASSDA